MEVLVQAELQLMSRAAVKQFQKPLSDLFQTEQTVCCSGCGDYEQGPLVSSCKSCLLTKLDKMMTPLSDLFPLCHILARSQVIMS